MLKPRYFTDSENRLVRIRNDSSGRKKATAAKGEFNVERENVLVYNVAENDNWKRDFDFPDKLRFKGRWRLNADHNLELILDDTAEDGGKDALTLKGEVAGVAADELDFLITSKKDRNVETTRFLKLAGKWKADEFNRLGFLVSKEDGLEDILIFDGLWEVGKDHHILYRYRKTQLKRKTKEERSLVFKGFWQITDKNRLAYMLDTSGESGFLFKVQLYDQATVGRLGVLKYRIGIGLSEYKRPVERVIKFFGALRFNLTKRDELGFEFTDSEGKKLGMNVTLTRKLLGGEAFVRFKKAAEESRVEAGLKILW